MKLFLVQHGEAVSKDIDPQRPLSKQGEHDVEKMAALLNRAGIDVERVLHSGKRRAQQTAEVLAKAVTASGVCDDISGMAPHDPVEAFAESIATFTRDTALVGHLPFMSRLASRLVIRDPERAIVAFQPGSIVCLEGDPSGTFTISWMLRPELLAKKAKG
ncbi:MAG: phosphohistidine phosphatase SixA [Gammaproteobacteria bacterium]|jgi:phosphohistidine phosphatase